MNEVNDGRTSVATPWGTLVDLLRFRAAECGDRMAYLWLRDGEEEEATWTYADLDRRARVIAHALSTAGVKAGDRALLLYPPGLDFILGSTEVLACRS